MRTKLRSKVTLLFMMLGLLLAFPAIALADTLLIQNDLNVNANATHAPGDTGTANVVLNVTNGTPLGDTNGCNANGSNPLTATLSSNNADVTFPSGNTATITGCGVAVPVTYAVSNSAAPGTAVISASVSGGVPSTTTNPRTYNTSDTLTVTITAPPNTAPTTPGTPGLASGSSTPNQGEFTLNWTTSTDAQSNQITYELQHKDANDPGFTTVTGAGSLNTNSFAFTNASPEAEGTWTYQVRASDGSLSSAFSAASSAIKVDKSAPNAPTASADRAPDYDGTGSNDWYKDTVTVSFSANGDPNLADGSTGSGVNLSTLTAPITKNTSGSHTVSGTVKDNVGLESAAGSITVQVDTNAPTFGDCPSGGPFTQNSGSHPVGPISASDTGESGVDSANSTLSDSVDTSTIGTKTVTFTAKDNVGHSATKQCTYSVIYNWDGFRQPVDNLPTLNTVKAGQSIPMKFSLSGNQGLNILQPATTLLPNPKITAITCPGGSTPTDAIEQTTTANNGLTYDATADQYNYVWKTQSTYANKCYRFDMTLIDGTTHSALFKFSK